MRPSKNNNWFCSFAIFSLSFQLTHSFVLFLPYFSLSSNVDYGRWLRGGGISFVADETDVMRAMLEISWTKSWTVVACNWVLSLFEKNERKLEELTTKDAHSLLSFSSRFEGSRMNEREGTRHWLSELADSNLHNLNAPMKFGGREGTDRTVLGG